MRKPTLCSVLLFTALSLVFSACHRQTREDLMSETAKYMREGNAKGAAVIFKSLVEKNPADEEARFELVRAYPTWSAGLTQAVGKTTLTLQTQADYQNNPGSSADVFQTTYVASAAYASGRATVTLRAGYSEYFGSSTHYAHDFTAGADIAYDLTDRLKLSLGAHHAGWDESFERRGNPIRYYGDAQILYQLPKDFAVIR